MGVRIYYDGGIYVEAGRLRFVVDPHRRIAGPVDFVLITHGHSDHTTRHVVGHLVVATAQTLEAIRARFGVTPRRRVVVRPGSLVEVAGAEVAVFEAGHVVGSVMYLVEVGGLQLAFTGDFNVAGSLVTDAADQFHRPDVLVMEATYGDPAYVFPNRAEIYNDILDFVESHADGVVALSAYPFGKAQELSSLLSGKELYVHPAAHRYNHIAGIRARMLAGRAPPGSVVIVPSLSEAPRGSTRAEVSGWYAEEARRRQAEEAGVAAFPLSDHSDFPGLLEFVEASRPRTVYTVYGFAGRLARRLSRAGFRAAPMPSGIDLYI